MNQNNIVFVISSLSGKGGMERVATLLANFLVDEQYNITVITRDGSEKQKYWFEIDTKVEIINIDGGLFSFLKSVQNYIENKKPNFVISHNMGKMSLALSLLTFRKHKSQLISFEHVANVSSPIYVQLLKRVLYHKVDKIAVLSNDDENNYKKFHKSVFKVLNPSPFDLKDDIIYNRDSKKIISIGRLTYQKGFDILLKSWSLIEKKYPDWSFEIYGEGEDITMLANLKKDLMIKNLSFKGFSANLEEKYRDSSFFVLSSRFEGFGMVLIEAHTFGVPTISFDCPHGPSDIITNEYNGILVKNGNIEQLSNAIELLINNEELRLRYSKNAIESVKLYNKNNIIKKWKEILYE